MKRDGVVRPAEAVIRTFDLAGDRWVLLIVRELVHGRTRYESMAVDLGLARNVLAARLRRLMCEGVLERVQYQERPDRYEYRLTSKGRGLVPVVAALDAVSEQWCGDPNAA
jgi:DNA-binding HxlR family transcriptional regulator